jgi:hypothetical protein
MSKKHDIFKEVLIENSESDTFEDAVKEWQDMGCVSIGDARCICTTPILYNYEVVNKINKKSLIIGSCCIKQFGIERTRTRLQDWVDRTYIKASNDWERSFMQGILEKAEKYKNLRLTEKQWAVLERIGGKFPYKKRDWNNWNSG